MCYNIKIGQHNIEVKLFKKNKGIYMLNSIGRSIFSYLKRADIILWILLISMCTYSLLLLHSVSQSISVNY